MNKNNPTIIAQVNNTYMWLKDLHKRTEFTIDDEKYALSKLDKLVNELFRSYDLCFVYTGDCEGLEFIRFEGPAIKVGPGLAKLLNLKTNKFYCYHKSSLVNSSLPLPNVSTLLLNHIRDTFNFKKEYRTKEPIGAQMVNELFDDAFDRTFNV